MEISYNKTKWVNSTAPSLNADNLNKIEDGILTLVGQSNLHDSKINEHDDKIGNENKGLLRDVSDLKSTSATKTDVEQVNNNISTLESNFKNHNHDSRYAPISHTHNQTDVVGLSVTLDKKSDKNHSHNIASTNQSGFLSAKDKQKLDGIESEAKNITVENTVTSTSEKNALAAAQGKLLNDKIELLDTELDNLRSTVENLEIGDMMKSVYDADNDGIVSKAVDSQKLNGKDASYYATKSEINSLQSSIDNILAGNANIWKNF